MVHPTIDAAVPGELLVALVYRIPVVWESLLQGARAAERPVPMVATPLAGQERGSPRPTKRILARTGTRSRTARG